MKLPSMVLGSAPLASLDARGRPRAPAPRGVVPAQGCLSPTYDSDTVVFSSMTPAELARTRTLSSTCYGNVDAYVAYLASSGRLQYVSALTAALRGALDQRPPAEVLREWGTGVVRLA